MDRVVKKEDEFDQSKTMLLEDYVVENNNNVNHSNNKSISIAERRAAKCGFNASNINDSPFRTTGLPAASQPIRSPYFFTVPPGLSPSALLDSPIMLPNSQAQLSPTTGTFQFPHLNHDNLKLNLKLATNGDNSVDTECSSTFNPQGFPHSISENLRVENEPFEEFKFPSEFQEMAKKDCYADASLPLSSEGLENKSLPDQSESLCFQASNNIAANQTFNHNNHSTIKERTTHQNPEKRQKAPSIPKDVAKYSEDGYYWRKYGQKQVKGSEYPRSYFKCTNTNCLVKKKVERSHDGQITEIVYKGSHNHPKSQPNMSKGGGSCVKVEGGNKDVAFGPDWRSNGVDGTSSTPFMTDFSDPSGKEFDQPLHQEAQELSSTFGSQDGEDQNGASPDSISFNDDEEENGECEPKRRKRDVPNEATISRSTREPRVVVQIESTIDILDDGYRWRKYGQKVVKGNPNPRSYYKCTTPGCPVRKHVERAANDIKSVVTTYEGKHNHEVPSSKNGTLVISDVANLPPAVTNNSLSTPQKPDIPRSGKQAQDQLPLYMERKPPILNYNLPGYFASDLTFGTSSIYPLSFPPFPSIPYNPLLLNGNHHMKTFPSSNLYPMLPDYMSLQSTMSQVPGTGNVPLGGNYQMNNYQAFQPSIPGQETKTLRPKEEQRDDGDLYSSCLSIQNHGNGAM